MRRIFKYVILTAVLGTVGLFSACRPKGVFSRQQMEDILVDIHTADGILDEAGYTYGHDEAVRGYYSVVLLKHNVTQEQFDSSLVWYTAHPQLFNKIYPRVLERLKTQLAVCDAENDREARDLQLQQHFLEFPQSLLNNPLGIAPLDSVYRSVWDAEIYLVPVEYDIRDSLIIPFVSVYETVSTEEEVVDTVSVTQVSSVDLQPANIPFRSECTLTHSDSMEN